MPDFGYSESIVELGAKLVRHVTRSAPTQVSKPEAGALAGTPNPLYFYKKLDENLLTDDVSITIGVTGRRYRWGESYRI